MPDVTNVDGGDDLASEPPRVIDVAGSHRDRPRTTPCGDAVTNPFATQPEEQH
jgi:hypothetical protein